MDCFFWFCFQYQGAANRKVAATHMNRESSRSHSVFACSIESKVNMLEIACYAPNPFVI
jgi:hypothetical protein